MSTDQFEAPRRPCAECPWRRDVATGQFSAERFRALAHTAYDLSRQVFAYHKSADDHPTVCAGFLARGAEHNLTVRLANARDQIELTDRSGGLALYEDYRAMAIANGVAADDPSLLPCRASRGEASRGGELPTGFAR
jgi:hypothetical protein